MEIANGPATSGPFAMVRLTTRSLIMAAPAPLKAPDKSSGALSLSYDATGALTHVKSVDGLFLFAGRVELLQVGPQIVTLVFAADAGKHHLGAGDLGPR